jgi:hypothetical protein
MNDLHTFYEIEQPGETGPYSSMISTKTDTAMKSVYIHQLRPIKREAVMVFVRIRHDTIYTISPPQLGYHMTASEKNSKYAITLISNGKPPGTNCCAHYS